MSNAVDVVQRWHEAVNGRDIEGALSLCHEDVAVGGPRGTAAGHEVMRAWLTRSGISLEPQSALDEQDGRIVVHELARWRTTTDAPTQAPTDEAVPTWVVFEVRDALVASVVRHESADEVPAGVGPGRSRSRTE